MPPTVSAALVTSSSESNFMVALAMPVAFASPSAEGKPGSERPPNTPPDSLPVSDIS